jgi:hypothetical protein
VAARDLRDMERGLQGLGMVEAKDSAGFLRGPRLDTFHIQPPGSQPCTKPRRLRPPWSWGPTVPRVTGGAQRLETHHVICKTLPGQDYKS